MLFKFIKDIIDEYNLRINDISLIFFFKCINNKNRSDLN